MVTTIKITGAMMEDNTAADPDDILEIKDDILALISALVENDFKLSTDDNSTEIEIKFVNIDLAQPQELSIQSTEYRTYILRDDQLVEHMCCYSCQNEGEREELKYQENHGNRSSDSEYAKERCKEYAMQLIVADGDDISDYDWEEED